MLSSQHVIRPVSMCRGICARLDVHQTIRLTTSTEASKLLSAVWQYTLSLSETELIIKDTGQLMYCHLSPLSKMSPKIAQDDFVELELDPVMKTGKVVLVGSTGVGKTTLLQRFLDDKSNLKVQPTIWPSIFCIRLPVFGEILSLEVWDTSGQEKYRTMAHFFFGGIDVALVVFDITKTATFTQAKTWASEILRFCKNPPILLLIGNKKDLTRRRQVSKIDALMYADKIGAAYMECSSTSHKDVCQVFVETSMKILKVADNTSLEQANGKKHKWYQDCVGFSIKNLFPC